MNSKPSACISNLDGDPVSLFLDRFKQIFILYIDNISKEFDNHNVSSRVTPLEDVKMFLLAHQQISSSTDSNQIYTQAVYEERGGWLNELGSWIT